MDETEIIALAKIFGSDGSSVPGVIVGIINHETSHLPSERPDGTQLQNWDYVKADRNSIFPFTIDNITFENKKDIAVYIGGNWSLNPSSFQNTIETPLNNSDLESLSGNAKSQFDNNKEIVNHIKNYKSVKTVDSLPTVDIKKDVIYDLTQDDNLNKIGVYYYGEDDDWHLLSELTHTLKIIPVSEDETIDEFTSIPNLTRDEFMQIWNAYNDNSFIILSNHNDEYRHRIINVKETSIKYEFTVLDFQNNIYITYSMVPDGSSEPTILVKSFITDICDNLNSTSVKEALSANMGKYIGDTLANLKSIGHFLSIWDCTTGLPFDDPQEAPYQYETGMFYLVGKTAQSVYKDKIKNEFVKLLDEKNIDIERLNDKQVSELWQQAKEIVGPIKNETNYRPEGTQYTPGIPSTEEETEDVNVGDFYWYSGTGWQLLDNTGAKITFANIRGLPSDNNNLNTVLNSKLTLDTNTSEYPKVYGKDTDGSRKDVPYTPDAYADSIVQRDDNNRFKVANPSVDEDAANKGYVDTELSLRPSMEEVTEAINNAIENVKQWFDKKTTDIQYTDNDSTTVISHYVSKIETNWKGLQFVAVQDNSTISYNNYNRGSSIPDVKYSYNTLVWHQWNPDMPLTLMSGQKLFVKGDNDTQFSTGDTSYTKFVMTGQIKGYGFIESLINNGDFTKKTLGRYCFAHLFDSCTSLIKAPNSCATTVSDISAYNNIFSRTGINTSPQFSASITNDSINGTLYQAFNANVNLQYVVVPSLTDLTTQTTFYHMMRTCDNLKLVVVDWTSWPSGTYATYEWLRYVSATGLFLCPSELIDQIPSRDGSGVPTGWKVGFQDSLDKYTLEEIQIMSDYLESIQDEDYSQDPIYLHLKELMEDDSIWWSNSNGQQPSTCTIDDSSTFDPTLANQDYKCSFTQISGEVDERDQFVNLRIIGLLHDWKEDGTKAGITLQAIHSLPQGYVWSGSSAHFWNNCALRGLLQTGGSLFNEFSTNITSKIKPVRKFYQKENITTASIGHVEDKIFFTAYGETWENNKWGAAESYHDNNGTSFNETATEGYLYEWYKYNTISGNSNNLILKNVVYTNSNNSPVGASETDTRIRQRSQTSGTEHYILNIATTATVYGRLDYRNYFTGVTGVLPTFCI